MNVETQRKKSGLPRYCHIKGRNRLCYFERKDYRVHLPDPSHPDFEAAYKRALSFMPAGNHLSSKTMEKAMQIRPDQVAGYFASRQNGAKARAKKANRDYTLPSGWAAQQYIDQLGVCAISGLTMQPSSGRFDFLQPSIDRIDSSKGYTPENCHLVAFGVNVAKGTMDLDDFVRMCGAIVTMARRTSAQHYGNLETDVCSDETNQTLSMAYARK